MTEVREKKEDDMKREEEKRRVEAVWRREQGKKEEMGRFLERCRRKCKVVLHQIGFEFGLCALNC